MAWELDTQTPPPHPPERSIVSYGDIVPDEPQAIPATDTQDTDNGGAGDQMFFSFHTEYLSNDRAVLPRPVYFDKENESKCHSEHSLPVQADKHKLIHPRLKKYKLDTPEDIAKWIEERKRNYPTEQNVDDRKRTT
ncbi:hypothetical protein EV182_006704, partial [Spiromyces aspiralis]